MTTEHKQLIAKLRYMGRQYGAGQVARGGSAQKHYLEEAADVIESMSNPAPVQEGWKLVPVEPTPEMIAAIPFPTNVTPKVGIACYRAMLAAAPSTGEPK